MSIVIDRRLLPHVAMVVAACGGSWFMLLGGRQQALADLEGRIAEARSIPSLVGDDAVRTLAEQAQLVRERRLAVERGGELARNPAHTYRHLMDLGAEVGTRVVQVVPAPTSAGRKDETTRLAVSVQMSGTFESVAAYLRAIDELPGFVHATGVSITPLGHEGEPAVSARVTVEMADYAIPDVLASIGGESSDE